MDNVFSSDIRRGEKPLLNDIHELLQVSLAKPIISPKSESENDGNYDFKPKTDKVFIRKQRTIAKVKKVLTVKDIRSDFEQNVYEYLPSELEKKEKYIYRKISNGLIEDAKAKKIIESSDPIRKNTFQMITNLNPKNKTNRVQYVFWNGKNIRVNGSTGGDKKFIVNFDLGKHKAISTEHRIQCKPKQKRNLIQKSLSIKFKPGPLSKKIKLDYSYQKFNVGPTELIKLPQIGLEVEPQIGKPLEPTISHILLSQRDGHGSMTKNWAQFAVATLSSLNNDELVQTDPGNVTFNLNYNNKQNVVLMRRDAVSTFFSKEKHSGETASIIDNSELKTEVKAVLNNIVDAVEISLNQNTLYSEEIDTVEVEEIKNKNDEEKNFSLPQVKDKVKRKYGELAKLDVTIINLHHSDKKNLSQACSQVHCRLGCVCASLECNLKLKSHCGHQECMFNCTCDFSRFKTHSCLDAQYSELLPGIINLDTKINSTLAKEEQKFHQTVVFTEDKSIVLKSQRRNTKAPKRYYSEFMETEFKQEQQILIKTEQKKKRFLTIPLTRLPCRNIEPWCMVHNLYKCFCKGRFTESTLKTSSETSKECESDQNEIGNRSSSEEFEIRCKRSRKDQGAANDCAAQDASEFSQIPETKPCARVQKYVGRRFENSYYKETNGKIKVMEENDKKIQERLLKLLKESLAENNECYLLDSSSSEPENPIIPEPTDLNKNNLNQTHVLDNASLQKPLPKRTHPNKAKLIAWLEANYKLYKNRLETRNKPMPLEPPKLGKIALYPWEVLLDRFNKNKNYFLVTREKPYRIFMAVDLKNPFLENCVNIEEISFNEVAKYPTTVKNLLQNISDLKDNFYILCGMAHCWELIGSVTKIRETSERECDSRTVTENSIQSEPDIEDPKHAFIDHYSEEQTESDYSKWFIMTVENDFTEIQFNNKGFFVKYENITKAINVARCSGKTVRLSSQKFVSQNNVPQFGLYAIPSVEQTCVFVGPYEKNEKLGITTVKKVLTKGPKWTRGFWITTKKIDDFKVIDNPLSFMPMHDQNSQELADSNSTTNITIPHDDEIANSSTEQSVSDTSPLPTVSAQTVLDTTVQKPAPFPTKKPNVVKLVKPIKLTKNNGFYQLAQDSVLKTVSLLKTPAKVPYLETIPCIAPMSNVPLTMTPIIKDTFSLSTFSDKNKKHQKPIAEIAPQVKTYGSKSIVQEKKGMLILKPEEINKKITEQINNSLENKTDEIKASDANKDTDMDIDKFLSTNAVCKPPSVDVFVISDDDAEGSGGIDASQAAEAFDNVWIESANTNINFGCIKGRKNNKNKISFEFPGFKFTEFYEEAEAFHKINQVLSRKIYIPKDIQLNWRVVDKMEKLNNPTLLKDEHLSRNLIVTRKGLRSKKVKIFELLKTGLNDLRETIASCSDGESLPTDTPIMVIDGATHLIGELKNACSKLEHEKESLQMDTSVKKSHLLNLLLQAPEDVRKETTEKIQASINLN